MICELTVMDEIHKRALVKCRDDLVKNINFPAIEDRLVQDEIFSDESIRRFKAEKVDEEKIRPMLSTLVKQGPNAFDKFISVLNETGHKHAADILNKKVHELKEEQKSTEENEPEENEIYRRERTPPDTQIPENEGPRIFTPLTDAEIRVHHPLFLYPRMEKRKKDSESTEEPSENLSTPYEEKRKDTPKKSYKMETVPRGLVLIINNSEFVCDEANRKGTEQNVKKLEELFLDMGCAIEKRNNLKGKEMLKVLSDFSQWKHVTKIAALYVFILSHGIKNDRIYGTDFDWITTKDVKSIFSNQRCTTMARKPKFILISAHTEGATKEDTSVFHIPESAKCQHVREEKSTSEEDTDESIKKKKKIITFDDELIVLFGPEDTCSSQKMQVTSDEEEENDNKEDISNETCDTVKTFEEDEENDQKDSDAEPPQEEKREPGLFDIFVEVFRKKARDTEITQLISEVNMKVKCITKLKKEWMLNPLPEYDSYAEYCYQIDEELARIEEEKAAERERKERGLYPFMKMLKMDDDEDDIILIRNKFRKPKRAERTNFQFPCFDWWRCCHMSFCNSKRRPGNNHIVAHSSMSS